MSAAIMFAAVTMAAQDPADKAAGKMEKMDKKAQSFTGCVQAGSAPGTYQLTNAMPAMASDTSSASKADMGTIMLSATDVDLAPHVGHKVTVTGTMSGKMKHGDMAKDDKAAETDKTTPAMESTGAMPSLKVKSLAMVSTTCS
jgi:hypothetical protein